MFMPLTAEIIAFSNLWYRWFFVSINKKHKNSMETGVRDRKKFKESFESSIDFIH